MITQAVKARRKTLSGYVEKALENGCDELSIKLKNGYKLVCMERNGQCYGVDKLESVSSEAAELKDELVGIVQRPKLFSLVNGMYFLKAEGFESRNGYIFHVVIKTR